MTAGDGTQLPDRADEIRSGWYDVNARDWQVLVRRVRMGRTNKGIANAVVHYGDGDGSRVRPGIARMEVELELGYNVIRAGLAFLRQAQLLRLVKAAARKGDADEYQLIIGPDVMELVEVLSPSEVQARIETIRAKRRGKYNPAAETDPQPTAWAAEPPDPDRPAAHGDDAETAPAAHADDAETNLQPMPLPPIFIGRPDTTPTEHTVADVDLDVSTYARELGIDIGPSADDPPPRRGRHAAPDVDTRAARLADPATSPDEPHPYEPNPAAAGACRRCGRYDPRALNACHQTEAKILQFRLRTVAS